MPIGNEKFKAAARAATCNMLSSVGSAAASYAAWGLLTPGPFDEWGALGLAGLAGLAYATGCQWDSNLPPEEGEDVSMDCCPEGGIGNQYMWYTTATRKSDGYVQTSYRGTSGGRYNRAVVDHTNKRLQLFGCSGHANWSTTPSADYFDPAKWSGFVWHKPATGCGNSPVNPPTPPPPYTYTDPDDGCQITATFQGFVGRPSGTVGAAWKLEPAAVPFASGGIIGGCNFSPVLHYHDHGGGGGGGGGDFTLPWAPGPDGPNGEPWWMKLLRSADGIGDIINAILRITELNDPGDTYRLVSACEKDAEGEPISRAVEVVIPPGLRDANASIRVRLEALVQLMQGLKDFKQPICESEPPPAPVGKNISIQFRSTVPSPFGEKRLRKVFRYRDPSLKELAEHRDHWRDFEWESGPWMVISEGLLWGKPQVWAKSEAEGKRVLRHAAQICGLNLDSSAHRWRVSEVVGLRERPVLRMKIHRDINGHYWIAERTGSAGLPLVAGQLSLDPGVDH